MIRAVCGSPPHPFDPREKSVTTSRPVVPSAYTRDHRDVPVLETTKEIDDCMRRAEEVQADHVLRPLRHRRDGVDIEGGGVGGKDRLRPGDAVPR